MPCWIASSIVIFKPIKNNSNPLSKGIPSTYRGKLLETQAASARLQFRPIFARTHAYASPAVLSSFRGAMHRVRNHNR